MVVAEILTGISLVKASVDFIKSNISTCQDIGQIAGQIDDLFRGEKEVQQLRNKKAGGGLGDQFGVNTVAKEIIDAKIAAENLAEVARLVDFRFGHGTWAGIVAERAKRIQEAKELAAAARRKKIQADREFEEGVKQFLLIGVIIAVAFALFVFLMVSVAKAFIV
tara:strand:+ start:48 stop:542 length:495 start_codon:yes stop_codon:yes gene_type:complete